MNFSPRLRILFFILAAFFLFFFLQNQIPLWSSDEGRFGEIAREMWESKNFIIPHFNYVPYLDKPILAPLLTVPFYALFGANPLTTRLVPILAALLGIFFTWKFTKKISTESAAHWTALLLLTTVGYVLVGRFAVIDMLMTFWLSLSLFSFFLGFYEKKSAWYLAAYTAMGFGFLTKGLIGIVLPSGIFFVFLIWSGQLSEMKRMKISAGILILCLIILPWFLLAVKKKSDFFQSFIVEQHFKRFTTASYGRKRPFWFFIPIFFALGAPWTFFLPAAIHEGLKQKEVSNTLKVKFLLCWIAGIILFFSIPKSKLPYYILPATVPLAILIGSFFAKRIEANMVASPQRFAAGASISEPEIASSALPPRNEGWVANIWLLLAALSVVGALVLNVYLSFFAHKPEILALKNFALLASLVLAAGFVTALAQFRQKGLAPGIFSLAVTIYFGLLLTLLGMKMISPIQSSVEEASLIAQNSKPEDEIFLFSSPDRFSDIPFYLKRRVGVAGSDWGTLKQQARFFTNEDKRYFLEKSDFIKHFVTSSSRIYTLTEEENLPELEKEGLKHFKILKQENGKVLISN